MRTQTVSGFFDGSSFWRSLARPLDARDSKPSGQLHQLYLKPAAIFEFIVSSQFGQKAGKSLHFLVQGLQNTLDGSAFDLPVVESRNYPLLL
jgi:hypothetical protein